MQVYTEPKPDPLVEYLLLVLSLDRLEELGLSQGPLSDRLREAMDMPWMALTLEEKGWVNEVPVPAVIETTEGG